MSKEEIIIGFKEQTGFRISECDLTTGKVVVNGIEITSVEDWEKVTKSILDLQKQNEELQQENRKLKERIDKAITHLALFISETNLNKYDTLKILMHTKKILKGEE